MPRWDTALVVMIIHFFRVRKPWWETALLIMMVHLFSGFWCHGGRRLCSPGTSCAPLGESHGKGTKNYKPMDIVTTRPNRPSGPIPWKYSKINIFKKTLSDSISAALRPLYNDKKTRWSSPVDRRPSTAEEPPIGEIHPFSKMTVTFEPLVGFLCPSGFRKFLIIIYSLFHNWKSYL